MDQIDKGALVQQRIKKMLENKKRSQLKETGDSTKRLKSGNADKNAKEEQDQILKPQSGLRMRRPVSAFKAAESTTITTTNLKIQIDVKAILVTVFDHGVKIGDFLKENRLEPNKYLEWLSNNDLFILSALGKLKEVPEQKQSVVLERQCIAKIARQLKIRQQLKKCEQTQSRISRILQERIKALSKHSNY